MILNKNKKKVLYLIFHSSQSQRKFYKHLGHLDMKVRKENIYDENKSSLSQCQLVSCGSRGICGCISKDVPQ